MRLDLLIILIIVGALIVLPLIILVLSKICCSCLNACSEDTADRRRRRRRISSTSSTSTTTSTPQSNAALREKIALVEGHDRLVREAGVRLEDYPFIADYEPVIVVPGVHTHQRPPIPAPRTAADGGDAVTQRPLPPEPDSESSSSSSSVSASRTSINEEDEAEVAPLLSAAAPIYAVPHATRNRPKTDFTVIEMQEIQTKSSPADSAAVSQPLLTPSAAHSSTDSLPHTIVPISEPSLTSAPSNSVPIEEVPIPLPRPTSSKEDKVVSPDGESQPHNSVDDALSSDSSSDDEGSHTDDEDSSSLNESDLEGDGSLSDSSYDSSKHSRSAIEVTKPQLPVRHSAPQMVNVLPPVAPAATKPDAVSESMVSESDTAVDTPSSVEDAKPQLPVRYSAPRMVKVLPPDPNGPWIPNHSSEVVIAESDTTMRSPSPVEDTKPQLPVRYSAPGMVRVLPPVSPATRKPDYLSKFVVAESDTAVRDSSPVEDPNTQLSPVLPATSRPNDTSEPKVAESEPVLHCRSPIEDEKPPLPARHAVPQMAMFLPSELLASRKPNDAREFSSESDASVHSSPQSSTAPLIDFTEPSPSMDVKESVTIETSPNYNNPEAMVPLKAHSVPPFHDDEGKKSQTSEDVAPLPVAGIAKESPTHESTAKTFPKLDLNTSQPALLPSSEDQPFPLAAMEQPQHSLPIKENELSSPLADEGISESVPESVEPSGLTDEPLSKPGDQDGKPLVTSNEDLQPIASSSSLSPVGINESHSPVEIASIGLPPPAADDAPLLSMNDESLDSTANKEETPAIPANHEELPAVTSDDSDSSSDNSTATPTQLSDEEPLSNTPPRENFAVARPIDGPVLTKPSTNLPVTPIFFESALQESTNTPVESYEPKAHSGLQDSKLSTPTTESGEESDSLTPTSTYGIIDKKQAEIPPPSETITANSSNDEQPQLRAKTEPEEPSMSATSQQLPDNNKPTADEFSPTSNSEPAELVPITDEFLETSKPPSAETHPSTEKAQPLTEKPHLVLQIPEDEASSETMQPAGAHPEPNPFSDKSQVDTPETLVSRVSREPNHNLFSGTSEPSTPPINSVQPVKAALDGDYESKDDRSEDSKVLHANDESIPTELLSKHEEPAHVAVELGDSEERPRESITDDVFGSISGVVENMFTTSPFPVAAQFMATPRANTDFVSSEDDAPSPIPIQKDPQPSEQAKEFLDTPSDLPASSSMLGQLVDAVEDLFAPNPDLDSKPPSHPSPQESSHEADESVISEDSTSSSERLPPLATSGSEASTPSPPVSPNVYGNEGAYEPTTLLARPRANLPLLGNEEDNSSGSSLHSPSTDTSGGTSDSNSDNNAYV